MGTERNSFNLAKANQDGLKMVCKIEGAVRYNGKSEKEHASAQPIQGYTVSKPFSNQSSLL